jgi:Fic-DOC domain mobile mystery protein B
MRILPDDTDGQTPLEEEEKEGLRIPTVATRAELDEWEQQNIEEAMLWLLGRRFPMQTILRPEFLRDLHRRMFRKVWTWAGRYRTTDKNLGVDKHQISVLVRALCDDTLHQHRNGLCPPDELAIRFKHRCVSIHPFPNGNGRHSRMMADAIIHLGYGRPMFAWTGDGRVPPDAQRVAYLRALRQADAGNIGPLLAFARHGPRAAGTP